MWDLVSKIKLAANYVGQKNPLILNPALEGVSLLHVGFWLTFPLSIWQQTFTEMLSSLVIFQLIWFNTQKEK